MTENADFSRIIAGCQQGDAACFSQLVNRYSRRCYGYFYRMTANKDVSDDLLGELFVKLVEKIYSYEGGCFDAWLFKIASNIFYDYLRARQRDEKLIEASRLNRIAGSNEQFEPDSIDELTQRLKELDADTREVIVLRFEAAMTFKEIAQSRREPIGTTLSKLHRGLKKLREAME